MEGQNRNGLRELQIAQGLVTLRWAAIPILLGFAVLTTRFLGMSFAIFPVYVLSCMLAIVNIYFTVHISMLSRQLLLRHGLLGLRRFMLGAVTRYMGTLRLSGVRALTGIPKVGLQIGTALYLMILESLKGLRFNVLSLDNVMHSQVIIDILAITLFTRYTGSAESPLTMLAVIPVIVASAVMGSATGIIYALSASGAYFVLALLVNWKFLAHIKFYGPQFGDLSLSQGWSLSSFIIMSVALLGAAFLANNLTAVFKERIFFLNQLLDKNRREGIAHNGVAEHSSHAWFILDPEGTVLKFKRGQTGLFPAQLSGKNLLEAVPAFKQHGLAYVLQAVVTDGKSKEIDRVRLSSSEGTTHTLACRLLPMFDSEGRSLILMIVDDLSELTFFKERVESLRQSLETSRSDLEKMTFDAREANAQLMKSLKQADDRSNEICSLTVQIRDYQAKIQSDSNHIDEINSQLVAMKSTNDALLADLSYKQVLLDEMTELFRNCGQIEALGSLVERRTKALFKLDNTCLHIFRTPSSPGRMSEVLDTRNASPRLLDLPRKNPKVLDPVLNDGQPVIIRAEVHPEKSATMAITNGSVHRLVAYIPIRHENEVIGMMMLDRYGPEESTDKMLAGLAYYLGHAAIALKNAINTRDLETQTRQLSQTIQLMENQSSHLMSMVRFAPGDGERPYAGFVKHMAELTGAIDVLMLRFHSDGSRQCLGRLNPARGDELLAIEEPVLRSLQANPTHKATVRSLNEGNLLLGFPLKQGNRLCGAILTHFGEKAVESPPLIETAARIAEEHLGMQVLREEKELWENFYQENLKT
ncbi:MAG: PAS domain-containing protein [Candidatus Riflebacteria bacterium]|nr:PAS domain-containing protein [Candidatus Riflebacteria bacterium]